ncbi:hypothetical protein [Dysgonomonas sp. ZJ279]|uniref:phosphoribosyltransferase-like protein n=1 Tax=Dysgonomonas sp. ZJ279 TaxID=2709796 RepID=UPI0013EBF07C|nr:hypothetical protein [Dysgonomonas sp. ZJ279]
MKKDDFYKYFQLYYKQKWLRNRKDELTLLIDLCRNKDEKNIIFSLLERFYYLDSRTYNDLLNNVADYIIKASGFMCDNTQIAAITYDDEADSSQSILQALKVPIQKRGWRNVKTVNRYGRIAKNVDLGKTQIIFVDEFIGSGKTLRGRIKQLRNDIKTPFELKCCYISGIESVINEISQEYGVEIFCPLLIKRGISDFYTGTDLKTAEDMMLDLELELAHKINQKELYDYSFGYGGAEALYSLEGCAGNTPNSVFPIFWWPQNKEMKERKTILFRAETGF